MIDNTKHEDIWIMSFPDTYTRIVKKNIPDPTIVDKKTFNEFISSNKENIVSEEMFSIGDCVIYFDKYNNPVAKFDFVYEVYSINPELLKLGEEQGCEIKDDFEIVEGEENIK